MVNTSVSRWELIRRLQERARASVPGSELEAVTEHAIDLALRDTRVEKTSEYLYWDVMKNSQFVIRRSRARANEALRRWRLHLESCGGSAQDIGFASPEHEIYASLALRELAEIAVKCGEHGPRLLLLLLGGNSIADAARELGVSRATAYRTIAYLRKNSKSLVTLAD